MINVDINIHRMTVDPSAYLGVRVRETIHATALPTGRPFTDDMREFVEHMARLGEIRRRPSAYRVGGDLYIHPEIADKLRRHIGAKIDRMAKEMITRGLK